MVSTSSPHPDGMVSFWRGNPHALDDYRSTPDLPAEIDVVIIGAGYAGASTAFHILDQSTNQTPPSVLILEARQACSGATGRNGGHLKPDPYNHVASIAAEYGYEAAAEVANFEASHVPALKAFIEKEEIDCDFVVTRAIDVQLSSAHRERLKAGYEKLLHAGVEATKNVFYASESTAEGLSGVKGAKGCFSYPAGHLWPYKLITGILARVLARGVNLQTHTPVSAVSEQQDESGRWVVQTPRGTVRAKNIVFATNAYTSSILPQYKNKIVPVRGICSRIVVPDPAPLLSFTYTLRWGPVMYDYLIPRADGSIVVGGARTAYLENLDSWYNNADDSKVIESAKSYFDGYMQRNFRGWENSGAKTNQVWTGIMGYSSDSLPHIGKVPGKSGQFILAGFTGHGMPEIFLSAKGVAAMLVNDTSFGETGIPRLYKTTQARLDSSVNKILTSVEDVIKPQPKL
ncbi:hypothetical protein AAFC00_005021 [Neodothiora populina]|uniref:FAD dependent oxidoreductase domain-containing protein n=1 Tax=Neodothiora populina TaxID=2781224 RepID=A0ABR3P4S4_9PEZI